MVEQKDKDKESQESKESADSSQEDAIRSEETFDQIQKQHDDMNATMMAIDMSKIDFNGVTDTRIKIQEEPSDNQIIKEQLEKKKSPITKFFESLKKRKKVKKPKGVGIQLPSFLKAYTNVWICPATEPIHRKVLFYFLRFFIVSVSIYLHYIIISQVQESFSHEHPAKNMYVLAMGVEILFVVMSVLFKLSPGWLVTLPLSLLLLVFGYGAYNYHTADPLLFLFKGMVISQFLNYFYFGVLVYSLILSLFLVAQRFFSRLLFFVMYLLCLAPIIINFYLKIDLEYSFFGVGFLSTLPAFYYQPIFLLFHLLLPLMFFVYLFFSFGTSRVPTKMAGRGFARSLAFLMIFFVASGFALMQKNRVWTALNILLPLKLDVGGVELEVLNQKLKLETKNFKLDGGKDNKSRYKISLKKGQKDNQFFVQVVDEFDFPVKNLTSQDFVLYSDGQRVKKFNLSEKREINYKRGSYILEVDLEKKQSLLSWDYKKKVYQNNENIEFTISDSAKIEKAVVSVGDDVLLTEIKPKNHKFSLPLYYFDFGDYPLQIKLYDQLDQEIYNKKFTIQVQESPGLGLLSPLNEDAVADYLPVLIMPKAIKKSDIKSVKYFIDGKMIQQSDGSLFFYTIDLNGLSSGAHNLEVKMQYGDNELSKTVKFIKKGNAPKVQIQKPNMGAFARRQTDVVYSLEGTSRKIAGVKVFVNGIEFNDYTIKDNSFVLPVARWTQSEIYLTVQTSLDNGDKISHWVQINKGQGILDVSFDTKSLGFLNYKRVAVILDASVSNLDSWQGMEKWKYLQKIAVDPKVNDLIKNLNPGYIVFGSSKPNYYGSCDDVDVLVQPEKYSHTLLKKKLSDYEPRGVSSLSQSLKKAYSFKPEKIFVFADGADACQKNVVKSVTSLINNNKGTQIAVFVLGQIANNDKTQLQELAESTGGKFYQPDNYEILLRAVMGELVLSYELYSQGELVNREPLGNHKFRLVPGTYTLKIPYGNKFQQEDFVVKNSTTTSLEISGKNDQVHINVRTRERI